jgi:tetratricopeptide (TPR) repeat protein
MTAAVVASTISDVASLWKLALIVAALVFVLVYKAPLRGVLEKGALRWRRKDTEIEFLSPPVAHTSAGRTRKADEEPAEPDEAEHEQETPLALSDGDPDSDGEPEVSLGVVFTLVSDEKLDEANELFKRVQEAERDATQLLRNEASYAAWRAITRADSQALRELEALADRREIQAFARNLLGYIYSGMGEDERALEAYDSSLELAEAEVDRVTAAIGAATALEALHRQAEADQRIQGELARGLSAQQTKRLYWALGDLYRDRGDWIHRTFALSKALELDPNDRSLRFALAYAASEGTLEQIAFMHYTRLLEVEEGHSLARNNLGVSAERLDMPIRSTRHYRAAWEQGNTLAAANLGARLMNAGFADLARDVLQEAAKRDDPHPNVGTNIGQLGEVTEAEDDQAKKVLESARDADRFARGFSAARFVTADPPAGMAGQWRFENGPEATLEETERGIAISWTDANDSRRRLLGTFHNRALELGVEVEEYQLATRQREFVKKSTGAYAFPEDERILWVLIESEESVRKLIKT